MINGGSGACKGNFRRDMTLRQWLGRPGRVVDRVGSLHIFRQILEFVDLAHVQGVILRNIRPSCFILSPFNRVAFIDSANTPSSSDRSSERSTGRASVQQHSRGHRYDEEAPGADALESTSYRRQVLGNVAEENSRRSWSSSQGRSQGQGQGQGHRQGQGSSYRNDQGSLEFSRENRRIGNGRADVILQSWRGSSSARWRQEWSGSSGSDVSGENITRDSGGTRSAQTRASDGRSYEGLQDAERGSGMEDSPGEEGPARDERFPQKQALLMEQTWYASPEELLGGTGMFASDIYSLGVMFFELFCTFATEAERIRVMSDLRHRILPPRLLSECPKEAAFCLWLLHPEPSSRPKAREILQCELLSEAGEALAERQAAVNVEEKAAESELLLDFLLRVQDEKQEAACKLNLDLSRLTSDIEEVERRRSILKQRGMPLRIPESSDRFRIAGLKEEAYLQNSLLANGNWMTGIGCEEDRKPPVLGKRAREDDTSVMLDSKEGIRLQEGPHKRNGDVSSKSARLMNNFSHLEKVYFSMRWKVGPPGLESGRVSSPNGSQTGGSSNSGGAGCNPRLLDQDSVHGRGSSDDWLGCFFDSLCKYARYSRFEVKATLRHGDLLNTANMVCSLSFDRDEEFFATAGVCKRIKVFECDSLLNENVDIHYPVVEMTSRSKLSSICWNSYIKRHIASSDYEGVVQLWDASTSQTLMEYHEHEKRAWSVDFSRADPTKLASGSDDGCVKMWSINNDSSIATIKTRANVCCVQFPPDASHLLVFGSADYKIYCYDLRTTKAPLCVLAGHNKTVSYVRFVDSCTLVSASTDNTLKLWDLNRASTGVDSSCALTYTGHTNEKNFVGLSVADGYIACGSEKNAVFAYHKSLPMPMASHKFGSADPITGQETEDDGGQFVSSVCWRGKSQTLVAANSMGNIKVLEMV
ncbi:hypothetical protein R1sor_008810 [Riccia sorocarpa]|uniref:Protein kinase domain-containing protein n=1 Tax=Riccia sorocarpa TaxID=122646 RepID=A0ABD3HXX4_9MARC